MNPEHDPDDEPVMTIEDWMGIGALVILLVIAIGSFGCAHGGGTVTGNSVSITVKILPLEP